MHLLATYEAYGLVDVEIRSSVGAVGAKVPGSPFGKFYFRLYKQHLRPHLPLPLARRIERVLTTNPGGPSANSKNHSAEEGAALPALTTGLLLISVAHLRDYAESYLPTRSMLREGFLEDVADLENPELSRMEKQRVVERMWRSWGSALGWNEMGKVRSS